ncbi:MAG: hypothetical protein R6U25_12260 [Alkalispirochaeta sp.]
MKRWIVWAGGGASLILLLAAALLLSRGDEPEGGDQAGRYTERELMMPGAAFQFPRVEDELLTPQIRSVVDPEEPLSRERVDALQMDTLEALYTDLNPRVENAVEDLLFEE